MVERKWGSKDKLQVELHELEWMWGELELLVAAPCRSDACMGSLMQVQLNTSFPHPMLVLH